MSTNPMPPQPPAPVRSQSQTSPSPAPARNKSQTSLSPTPGTKGYTNLQLQIMKDTLAAIPEPIAGTRRETHSSTRERLDQWTKKIAFGEAQIRKLGPRVSPDVLRTTLQLQCNRSLLYWRVFRFMDLPPEIISNIFHLVVWSTNDPSEGVRQRLHLTWVCRAWRRLMTEDPMIWNAIWFHDTPPYERSWEWFKRADSARLDIRINEIDRRRAASDRPKFSPEQMSGMLDRLFTKLSQIRMLVIIVENWPPALTVLQKLQAAGSAGIPINIERFEIHRTGLPYVWIGPGYDTQGHRDPAILFGGQTRQLQYLCLSGIHIDFNATPLSNLTTLDLRHIAMESSPTLLRFRDILEHCPRLEKLTLDGCGPQPEEKRLDHTPVSLLYLKTFTLGSFNLPFACFIVAQIDAPRLRDLTLMAMSGASYTPLIAMLTRRSRQVRILTLYHVELDMSPDGRGTFVRWLDSMPEIGYARLARIKPEVLYTFAENPMKYRATSQGGSEMVTGACDVLCPKFQCMEIQAVPPLAIAEFCRLRKSLGVPMKRLYLNSPWAQSLTHENLKLLQQEVTLYIAPVGANTEEENKLLEEDE